MHFLEFFGGGAYWPEAIPAPKAGRHNENSANLCLVCTSYALLAFFLEAIRQALRRIVPILAARSRADSIPIYNRKTATFADHFPQIIFAEGEIPRVLPEKFSCDPLTSHPPATAWNQPLCIS